MGEKMAGIISRQTHNHNHSHYGSDHYPNVNRFEAAAKNLIRIGIIT